MNGFSWVPMTPTTAGRVTVKRSPLDRCPMTVLVQVHGSRPNENERELVSFGTSSGVVSALASDL